MRVMRNLFKKVVVGGLGIVLFVGNGFCEGIEVGNIVEVVPEAGLIQVHDHIFKVTKVTVVTEEREYPGAIRDLKEGGLVKVMVGKKTDKQWEADLVTLYLGDPGQPVGGEQLPDSSSGEREVPSQDQPVRTEDASVLRLQDGVWRN